MKKILDELLTLLRLEAIEPGIFRGQSQDLGWGRVYGGQVLGQALMAASATIAGRGLHSMHSFFVRPGDTHQPIDYHVEQVRDGGSFSVRRVVAHQDGRPIFILSSSFQVEEEGYEHQFDMPDVPGPDGLPSELDLARANADHIPEVLRSRALCERPIEMRPIDPIPPGSHEARPPRRYVWIRAVDKMPDDSILHQCLLAYASDWGLLATSLRPHGVTIMSRHVQSASLDHAMWFHRAFRADEWLLYATDSPSASGARGFTRGEFYSQDGRLVASTVQEGLIRKRTQT